MVQFSTTLSPSFREESLCFARFHQIFALHSVRWIYGSSVFEIPYTLFDVEILVFYNINTFCPLKLSLIELYASRVPTKCLFCRMNCILQSAFAEVLLKVLFLGCGEGTIFYEFYHFLNVHVLYVLTKNLKFTHV